MPIYYVISDINWTPTQTLTTSIADSTSGKTTEDVTMTRAGSWWLIYCTDLVGARGKDETSTPGISPSFSTTTTPPPAIPAVMLLTMIHGPWQPEGICATQLHSKHGTFIQCCFDVGPASWTMGQHQNNVGYTFLVCWMSATYDILTARG